MTPPQPTSSPLHTAASRPLRAQAIQELAGPRYVKLLQKHLDRLHQVYQHPNRTLHQDTVLVTLLLSFRQPISRSLRQIDLLSQSKLAIKQLPNERVCRATLSDALAQMDPGNLLALLGELARKVPALARHDSDLASLLKRVIAADGSVFTVPADVLWAIATTRRDNQSGRQIRLNLQLDVLQFLPVQMSVSGDEDGSESAAFARDLLGGVIYVVDRNFVDFKFIHAVFDKQSDLVVRLKSDTRFLRTKEQAISDQDRDANVQSDHIGHVPGSAGSPGFGDKLLREVIVIDPRSGKPVRLLTNLLDVPARIIGLIYRHRWTIELFFKWLKSIARVRHLFSHSQNGIATEFYVAVISVLLEYLNTGRRPSTYTFACLSHIASGIMNVEQMMAALARLDRERELDRARRARNRAKLTVEKVSR